MGMDTGSGEAVDLAAPPNTAVCAPAVNATCTVPTSFTGVARRRIVPRERTLPLRRPVWHTGFTVGTPRQPTNARGSALRDGATGRAPRAGVALPGAMGPRWTRRSVQVNLGTAGCVAASHGFATDRPRYRAWRTSKPSLPNVANAARCSVASQTATLVLLSACMLLYILVNPVDPESGTERPAQLGPLDRLPSPPLASSPSEVDLSAVGPRLTLQPPLDPQLRRASGDPAHAVSDTRGAELPVTGAVVGAARESRASLQPATNLLAAHPEAAAKVRLQLLADTKLELFADPTSNYYPAPNVCRIFGACMDRDGGLLLHSDMRPHMAVLRACGAGNARFVNETADERGASGDGDLFTNVLRYHMPHLASDVLSLSYAMTAVGGQYEMDQPLPHRSKSARPVVIAQSRVRKMPPGAWTPKLLSMLPNRAQVKTWEELFPDAAAPSERVCFRSIVSFDSQVYWQVSPERFGPKNALFAQNSLWTRYAKRSGTDDGATGARECAPIVAVLNRPPAEQRTLANIDEIAGHFDALRKTPKFSDISRASLRVGYMNTTFADQVQTVQDADVILASHGAALANLVFTRTDTPVVEVFPFST
jgi:hypothetical protein